MKREALYQLRPSEIDIEGSADAAPVCDVASGVFQKVIYRNEVESDAGALEGGSFAAPIAKHVRAVNPRCRWSVADRLRVRRLRHAD